ncbi:hypothetical protein [Spiroplasma floricola]|nr:hypothetical protein [Spiroplasma floricola]
MEWQKLKQYKDHIYTGTTSVTYKTKLRSIVNEQGNETKNIYVHAYNSTQNDEDTILLTYKPSLGKQKFTEYFKNINFEWYSKTWNNGRKRKGGDIWYNEMNKNGSKNSVSYTNRTISLSGNQGKTELYNRIYSGTNYMKVYGYFEYAWIENEILEMKFKVTAESYASWINAYWADAKNQLFFKNLSITV